MECRKCGRQKMWSVEYLEYRKCENVECRICGVQKMWSVEKFFLYFILSGVQKMQSEENEKSLDIDKSYFNFF